MDELCRLRRSEGYGICFDEPVGTKLCEAYGVQKSRRREPSAFVLVVAKTTPGYAGGKEIAFSEERRRQEKSSLLD